MAVYLVIPLIEVALCLAMLVLLVTQGRRHVGRKPFALFLSCMALWGLFIFLMRFTSDLVQALLWEKLVLFAILSASVSFFWFTASFTGTHISKRILILILVSCLCMIGLIPANLIVSGMQSMWYGKAPVIEPLFPLYTICVYFPLILGALAILKHHHKSKSSDQKTRDQYIIAGIITMFIGGTTDYLPVIGIGIYPLGIPGGIIFGILTTIAMLRYGLLEIRVVLRKGAAYSMVSILIFGIFGSILLLLSNVFIDFVSPLFLAITITAIFVIAAIFQPLLLRMQDLVDRWFFRQRYDYLKSLQNFSKKTEGVELNQISASLVTTVANGMQSSGVYLLLPSPLTGDFVTCSFSGFKNEADISFSANSSLAIIMKYRNRIMDSNDVDAIPSLNGLTVGERRILLNNNIDLLMPLKYDDRLTGMLLLANKTTGEFYSNEDRQILQSVSEDIAARIDGARRYENMKIEQRALQKAMEGVIYAISAVVESRDPYTAGHQRRVAELARAIAGELGLSEWEKQGMHIIGLLHDVGKIAVPAEILSKPGKINQFEFDIIKNHSQLGSDILEKIDFPWPVSKSILQHHERLDGSGYPGGLCNSEIILEARILSIADVVEAMSSHRPYRPALGLELALKEITDHSGILYDHEVVDACLRLLQNNQFAFEQLMSAAGQEGNLVTAKIKTP